MERNPRNANLPALYTDGIFRNTSIVLEPKHVVLGTVNSLPQLQSLSIDLGQGDIQAAAIAPYSITIWGTSPKAYTALTQLSNTYITVGPWATNNGQNGWIILANNFTASGSAVQAVMQQWSSNISPFSYPFVQMPTSTVVSGTANYTYATFSSTSSSLSQPFFEINQNAFDANQTYWSGNSFYYLGDVRGLFGVGNLILEKSYNSNTQFKVYDFAQAKYKNCSIESVASSLTYKRSVVFTSSGAFVKANYPEAKAVRVIVVGGGGGSGAVRATSSNQVATVSGGGAGAATVVWYDIDTLNASCAVVVGTAGVGGATPSSNGSSGGQSSFTAVAAGTGPFEQLLAGGGSGSSSTAVATPPTASAAALSGFSTVSGTRYSKLEYSTANNQALGAVSFAISSTITVAGGGGGHFMGNVGESGYSAGSSLGVQGMVFTNGISYGGGGGGQANPQSRSAITGGSGQPGVVVVEIYG